MARLKLREIEKRDLILINQWRNDREVIDHLGNNFLYISPIIDEKWLENYLSNRDKAVRLAIIDLETEVHIGNVNLTSLHPINRTAEFSIFIGDKNFWSRGFGYEATMLMLAHGFKDLNLNRIHLTVLQKNTRAIKTYLKAGFKEEGTIREGVFKNGLFYNLIYMGILRKEFQI